jgi:hypothetical protein
MHPIFTDKRNGALFSSRFMRMFDVELYVRNGRISLIDIVLQFTA